MPVRIERRNMGEEIWVIVEPESSDSPQPAAEEKPPESNEKQNSLWSEEKS